MTHYLSEPTFRHGTASAPGILLVNLGTPDAPTVPAVRRYLAEFLSDPRVVEIPRWIWLPVLHGIILRTRPSASAKRYAAIWTPDGSPLQHYTVRQAAMLRERLGERSHSRVEVEWAMRYGTPSIEQGLNALKTRGCDRILLMPLYPQYAASTTASAFDALGAAMVKMRNLPAIRFVKHFHDDAGYIGALAQNIDDYWKKNGSPDKLVMSFHGVPRFSLDRGDPYHCECHATARLLAQALGLSGERYQVTFQSRFGRTEWLRPYTAEALVALGRARTGRVDVVCPGFVSDCLETLEEIALEAKGLFLDAGGRSFHYIPCLNESDPWIRALTELVWTHLQGWLDDPDAAALAATRERALALGAAS
jgi:ferrochelatase